MKLIVIALSLVLCCGACTVTSTPNSTSVPADSRISRSAIVTMGAVNLDRNKPSTLSWIDEVEVIGEHQSVSISALQHQIRSIVQYEIVGKGYPFVAMNGDFQLHATLILAGKADKKLLLQESGGIDPGLTGADDMAGKGSLVIELRQGRIQRWRGAVQIYILPEYDAVTARQRIEYAVRQLLQTWPAVSNKP